MTTEDDFQRAMDANRADRHTFLVFADWLDDRDDPRAAGYRALGMLGSAPYCINQSAFVWYSSQQATGADPPSDLPDDWFEAIGARSPRDGRKKKFFESRREAHDAAARAFTKLTDDQRAAILATAEVTA